VKTKGILKLREVVLEKVDFPENKVKNYLLIKK